MHRDAAVVEAHLEGFNCSVKDCTEHGTSHPVLVLRTKKYGVPFRVPIAGVRLCAAHKINAVLSDVLTDETWVVLLKGFDVHNKQRPKRMLTTLDFCEVNSREARPWYSILSNENKEPG